MPSNGIRSNGHKLNHKKFHISTKNGFITWRAAEHWNGLPGEMAESPPLETPQAHLDAFQRSLPWCPCPGGVQRCLPAGPPRVSREGARGHLLAPPPPSRAAQPGARVTGPGARAAAVTCPRRAERAGGGAPGNGDMERAPPPPSGPGKRWGKGVKANSPSWPPEAAAFPGNNRLTHPGGLHPTAKGTELSGQVGTDSGSAREGLKTNPTAALSRNEGLGVEFGGPCWWDTNPEPSKNDCNTAKRSES